MATSSDDRWRFIKSINYRKDDLSNDETLDLDYNAFFINRSLSYHYDTLYHAFLMDKAHDLPKKLQYLYYLNKVGQANRFAKAEPKLSKADDLQLVQDYFKINTHKARGVLAILTKEQLKTIKEKSYKGGEKRGNG